MRKTRILALLLCLCLTVACLAGCGKKHEHTWAEATCTEPKTCSECGETEGEASGHVWVDATCTEPKTCSVCGKTRGMPLGHKMTKATTTEPATCTVCGMTEGGAVPYAEAHHLPFTAERHHTAPMVAFLTPGGDLNRDEYGELMRAQGYTVAAENAVYYLCDATKSGPDADGIVTVTIPYVIKCNVPVRYDGYGDGGEFWTWWQYPTFGVFDYYSGCTVPLESGNAGEICSNAVEFSFDGKDVAVGVMLSSEVKSNDYSDWVDVGGGAEECRYTAEYWYTLTVMFPQDYDGLCLEMSKLGITRWIDSAKKDEDLTPQLLLDTYADGDHHNEGPGDLILVRVKDLIV